MLINNVVVSFIKAFHVRKEMILARPPGCIPTVKVFKKLKLKSRLCNHLFKYFKMAKATARVAEQEDVMKDEITFKSAARQLQIVKQQHSPYCDEAFDLAIDVLQFFDINQDVLEEVISEIIRNRPKNHRVF